MPGQKIKVEDSVNFENISNSNLLEMSSGIEMSLITQIDLANNNKSVLTVLLNDEINSSFREWQHLPSPDVYCEDSGSQYYYHSHNDREAIEHGHFHTFIDLKKISPNLIKTSNESARRNLTQLIGISVNSRGIPFRLFTTNRWISDDTFVRSEELISLVGNFNLLSDTRYPEISKWLHGLVKCFMPQIKLLLQKRDEHITAWSVEHFEGIENAIDLSFEDRSLEVPSYLEIDLITHANKIDEEITKRGLNNEL